MVVAGPWEIWQDSVWAVREEKLSPARGAGTAESWGEAHQSGARSICSPAGTMTDRRPVKDYVW